MSNYLTVMNSPKPHSSPSFKNLRSKHKQSPIAIKEKMRKDYKDKVHNCRNLLLNKFRGPISENELRDTLHEMYKSIFSLSEFDDMDEEESNVLEEVERELIEEEMQWLMEEYEKSQMNDVDWSILQQENVICPVCQKTNLNNEDGKVACVNCSFKIKTENSLSIIKKSILDSIEKHGNNCNKVSQFTLVGMELNENHIYLICDECMDMQLVL